MLLRKTIWVAYTGLIAFLSLSPSRTFEGLPTFSYEDLLVHFLIYAVYALLFMWAWRPDTKKHPLMTPAVIAGCASFGIIMEILQPIVQPGDRTFAISDIIAYTAGATAVVWLFIRRQR